jgi:hypothetical protein
MSKDFHDKVDGIEAAKREQQNANQASTAQQRRTGPSKPTKDQLERAIARVDYTLGNRFDNPCPADPLGQYYPSTLTLCTITLYNGFSVTGQSACVEHAEYSLSMGRDLAYADAQRKLWQFFAFLNMEDHRRGGVIDTTALTKDIDETSKTIIDKLQGYVRRHLSATSHGAVSSLMGEIETTVKAWLQELSAKRYYQHRDQAAKLTRPLITSDDVFTAQKRVLEVVDVALAGGPKERCYRLVKTAFSLLWDNAPAWDDKASGTAASGQTGLAGTAFDPNVTSGATKIRATGSVGPAPKPSPLTTLASLRTEIVNHRIAIENGATHEQDQRAHALRASVTAAISDAYGPAEAELFNTVGNLRNLHRTQPPRSAIYDVLVRDIDWLADFITRKADQQASFAAPIRLEVRP